jgi:hypothetical protein
MLPFFRRSCGNVLRAQKLRFFSITCTRFQAEISDSGALDEGELLPTERIRNIAIIAHGW